MATSIGGSVSALAVTSDLTSATYAWETSKDGINWATVANASTSSLDASSQVGQFIRAVASASGTSETSNLVFVASSSGLVFVPPVNADGSGESDVGLSFAQGTAGPSQFVRNPADYNMATLDPTPLTGAVELVVTEAGTSTPRSVQITNTPASGGSATVVYTITEAANGSHVVSDGTNNITLIGFDAIGVGGQTLNLQTDVYNLVASGQIAVEGTPWQDEFVVDLVLANGVTPAASWVDGSNGVKVLYDNNGSLANALVTVTPSAANDPWAFRVDVSEDAAPFGAAVSYFLTDIETLGVSVGGTPSSTLTLLGNAGPEVTVSDQDGDQLPEFSGHADPNTTVTITAPDGSTTYTAQTDASGNYSIELPVAVTGTYSVSETEGNAQHSVPVSLDATGGGVAPNAPKIVSVIAHDGIVVNDQGGETIAFDVIFDQPVYVWSNSYGPPILWVMIGESGSLGAQYVADESDGNHLRFELTLPAANESGSGPVTVAELLVPTDTRISGWDSNADYLTGSYVPIAAEIGHQPWVQVYNTVHVAEDVDAANEAVSTTNNLFAVDSIADVVTILDTTDASSTVTLTGQRDLLAVAIVGSERDRLDTQAIYDSSQTPVRVGVEILLNGASTGWSYTFANNTLTNANESGGSSSQAVTGFEDLVFYVANPGSTFAPSSVPRYWEDGDVQHISLAARSFHFVDTENNDAMGLNHDHWGTLASETFDLGSLPTVNAAAGTFGQLRLHAGGGADTITGSAGMDFINPGGGNDTVNAGAGNDHIAFSSGVDIIDGGGGEDTLRLFDDDGRQPKVRDVEGADGKVHVQEYVRGKGFVDAYTISTAGTGASMTVTVNDAKGNSATLTNVERIDTGGDEIAFGPREQTDAWGGQEREGTRGDDLWELAAADATTTNLGFVDGKEGKDTVTITFESGVLSQSANGIELDSTLLAVYGTGEGISASSLGEFKHVETLVLKDTDAGSADIVIHAADLKRGIHVEFDDDDLDELNDDVAGSQSNDDVAWLSTTRSVVDGFRVLDGKGGHDWLVGTDIEFESDGTTEAKDDLRGGLGDDHLEGRSGVNRLDGGEGRDKASYEMAVRGVRVDIFETAEQDTGISSDTILNVENLLGSAFADTLGGSGWSNVLDGNDGHDELRGGRGHDELLGGAGDDALFGGIGNDVLNGGQGSDVLSGGVGADTFVFDASILATDLRSIDDIVDFNVFADKIKLEGAASGASLSYDITTGELSYDSDGDATEWGPQVIALLDAGLNLGSQHLIIA